MAALDAVWLWVKVCLLVAMGVALWVVDSERLGEGVGVMLWLQVGTSIPASHHVSTIGSANKPLCPLNVETGYALSCPLEAGRIRHSLALGQG